MASRTVLSRRAFLRGIGISGAMVSVGLPPLDGMFNSGGTAYATEAAIPSMSAVSAEPRFLLWFNGNGIAEKYWIPSETGSNYTLTPCLAPLAPFRNDVHAKHWRQSPCEWPPTLSVG